MPTVTEAFAEFKSRLELTPAEREKAASRHPGVRTAIGEVWDLIEDFLTGSYKRDTKIRPLSDIDLSVVLNGDEYGDLYYYGNQGYARVLDDLESILHKAYLRTPVRVQSHSVNLDFSDFGFDVVPAFRDKGGFYWIPDQDRGKWIKSYPKHHTKIPSEMNDLCDGKLKPVIKMFKCWNRNSGDILKSFHIEALSLKIFREGIPTSFQEALSHFFYGASFYMDYQCYDPADGAKQIDDYLTSVQRVRLKTELESSWDEANMALDLEAEGQHSLAVSVWKELIGKPFPGA